MHRQQHAQASTETGKRRNPPLPATTRLVGPPPAPRVATGRSCDSRRISPTCRDTDRPLSNVAKYDSWNEPSTCSTQAGGCSGPRDFSHRRRIRHGHKPIPKGYNEPSRDTRPGSLRGKSPAVTRLEPLIIASDSAPRYGDGPPCTRSCPTPQSSAYRFYQPQLRNRHEAWPDRRHPRRPSGRSSSPCDTSNHTRSSTSSAQATSSATAPSPTPSSPSSVSSRSPVSAATTTAGPSKNASVIGLRGWKPARLKDDTWEFLENLPTTLNFELAGRKLVIHHGSPASDMEFVSPYKPLPRLRRTVLGHQRRPTSSSSPTPTCPDRPLAPRHHRERRLHPRRLGRPDLLHLRPASTSTTSPSESWTTAWAEKSAATPSSSTAKTAKTEKPNTRPISTPNVPPQEQRPAEI